MKKFLLFALAVVAMASCKKDPYNPTIKLDGDEIQFLTSATTKGLSVNYDDDTHKGNFVKDDQIGIFVANNNNEEGITYGDGGYDFSLDGTRVNVGYTFAEPFWKPNTLSERLKFAPVVTDKSTTGKTKVFAFFPYSGASKYSFTPETYAVVFDKTDVAKPTLKYNLPLEQAENADLRLADLMFAKSLGDAVNTGWQPTTKAVNLDFYHLLTKASFEIKLENKVNPGASKEITRYIRAIEIASVGTGVTPDPTKGQIIVAQGLKVDLFTGDFLTEGNEATGSVWSTYFAENKGLEIKTDANGAPVQAGEPLKDVTANIDMLLIPFSQIKDANKFYVYLSSNNTVIADKTALEAAVKDGTVEKYTVNVEEAVAGTGTDGALSDADLWNFTKGRANKFVLPIDPGKKTINVTTTVQPWSGNTIHNPEID